MPISNSLIHHGPHRRFPTPCKPNCDPSSIHWNGVVGWDVSLSRAIVHSLLTHRSFIVFIEQLIRHNRCSSCTNIAYKKRVKALHVTPFVARERIPKLNWPMIWYMVLQDLPPVPPRISLVLLSIAISAHRPHGGHCTQGLSRSCEDEAYETFTRKSRVIPTLLGTTWESSKLMKQCCTE